MADDKQTDFIATARKRFAAASEDEKYLREEFRIDINFVAGIQWDPQLKLQREQAGRPAMTFPRCHTFVQQVANEARQNKPQIKFAPKTDGPQAKETAEVLEGLARHIQYSSDAQVAYETAVEYSAGGGFGCFRFLTDYVSDDSDEQELKVVPVLDPLTVYGILVPACFGREPKYAFVIEDVPKDEFKAMYPDSEISSTSWADAEARADGWIGSESVRVAEYWYVEETKVKGKRRPKRTVKFCKITGLDVLPDTETEWVGSTIPIIPVLGKQLIVEGRPTLMSVVRPQRDPQKMINYAKTRIAETLSTAPISPFMVANGQIAGFEKQWEALNTKNTPFLTYNQVDVGGKPAPPPARQTFEPPIQSLSAFVAQEVDDMKATTGIFDASLGQNGNEVSGQAIARRQQQTNLSVMHFMDNLERAFKKGGNVIAEAIPKIYDTARTIRILGEDEAAEVVKINQQHTDATGKPKLFDTTNMEYDVVVTMGRSFSSKRMESFDTMQQILQNNPNLMQTIGDIFFRNSDMAGADQLADRFKVMQPPAWHDKNNPIPPEAQAAIGQAQQQMQMMQGELQKLQFEKQAKVVEHQSKLQQIQLQAQADIGLEKLKLENQLAIAEVSTKAQNINERVAAVEDMMQQFHAQAHERAMQAQDHAQQQQVAAQQQAHQQQLAGQQADAQSQLSAQNAQQSAAQQQAQAAGAQSSPA